jgi:hypothetical protein
MELLFVVGWVCGPFMLLAIFCVYMAYRPEKKQDGKAGISTE